MSAKERVWWSAEVTDPVTGEVTVLQADSEVQLDDRIEALLHGTYPLPVESGAGSADNLAAVREVMKFITSRWRTSSRLTEVTNGDGRVTRMVIGVGVVPTDVQLADVEAQVQRILGGSWRARWDPERGSVDIAPTSLSTKQNLDE